MQSILKIFKTELMKENPVRSLNITADKIMLCAFLASFIMASCTFDNQQSREGADHQDSERIIPLDTDTIENLLDEDTLIVMPPEP